MHLPSDMASCPRVRVNGALLTNYIGAMVNIVGKVIDTDPSGSSFDIKTCDKQVVSISMRQPLSEPISGIVEVHGVAKNKSTVVCNYFMVYPKELEDTYDPAIVNDMITTLHNFSNVWKD